MAKIAIRAIVKKFNNGSFLFLPATNGDKRTMDTFASEYEGKYVTLTAAFQKGTKTFEQVKTVWALISIYHEAAYHRKPNQQEADNLYNGFIEEFAPRETDLRHPDKTIPVTLSRMSAEQAISFIQSIMNEIITSLNLSDVLACDVSELFNEFQMKKSSMVLDPTDYDENGNLLTVEEWVKRNPVSHASGSTENLEISHIVSKATAPQYRNCCWNFLRLTHDEHINIWHAKGGAEELLKLYPHLIGRVKRAREMAHKLDMMGGTSLDEMNTNLAADALGLTDNESESNIKEPIF